MRRLAANAVVLIFATGCGGGEESPADKPPPSPATFMRQANQVCIAERDFFAFEAPDPSTAISSEEFQRAVETVGDRLDQNTDALDALVPPRRDGSLVARWLRARREVARLYREVVARAFSGDRDNPAEQRAVEEQIRNHAGKADTAARKLDLRKDCSRLSPPDPGGPFTPPS